MIKKFLMLFKKLFRMVYLLLKKEMRVIYETCITN